MPFALSSPPAPGGPRGSPVDVSPAPGAVNAARRRILSARNGALRLRCPERARAAAPVSRPIMDGPTGEAVLHGRPGAEGHGEDEARAADCVRVFPAAYGAGRGG